MKTKQPKGTTITLVKFPYGYACYKGDVRRFFRSKAPSTLFVAGSDRRWGRIGGRPPAAYSEDERRGYPKDAKRKKDWRESAECKNEDPSIFFPKSIKDKNKRKAAKLKALDVCSGCPVREECLRHALERPERFGIWGGVEEEKRAIMLKDFKNRPKEALRQ